MAHTADVLIVDDDPLVCDSLNEVLRQAQFATSIATSAQDALNQLHRQPYRVVLTDLRMPRMNGLELLQQIKQRFPQAIVVVMSGYGTIDAAVEAIRSGAADFLTKPIQDDELTQLVTRLLQEQGGTIAEAGDPCEAIIGHDRSLKALCESLRMVAAASASTVLLEGESGTGKRLIASTIHRLDPQRRGKPFIEVSCAALPDTLLESELFGHVKGAFTDAIRDKAGRFELADGGTLLLDEIDTCSPALQAKLLRVLQERSFEAVGGTKTLTVDVRVIAATNRPLATLVKERSFRTDLFYRLNVITFKLPSLRERRDDIPLIAEHFLRRMNETLHKAIRGFTPEALERLTAYCWPGNVRELENAIERAAIFTRGAEITEADLPETLAALHESGTMVPQFHHASVSQAAPSSSLKEAMQEPERTLILNTLEATGWNRTEAAKRLRINRTTLYHKMRRFGIRPHILPQPHD